MKKDVSKYLSEIGKRGGKATSPRKKEAARRNAKRRAVAK